MSLTISSRRCSIYSSQQGAAGAFNDLCAVKEELQDSCISSNKYTKYMTNALRHNISDQQYSKQNKVFSVSFSFLSSYTVKKTHNVERRQTLKQVSTDVLFFYSIETTALDKCWSRKPCCGHTHTQTHTLFFLSLSHTPSLTHTHTFSQSMLTTGAGRWDGKTLSQD